MKIRKGYTDTAPPSKVYAGERWKATMRLYGENSSGKRGKVLEEEVIQSDVDPTDEDYCDEDKWNDAFYDLGWLNMEMDYLLSLFGWRVSSTYELLTEPNEARENDTYI